MKIYIIYRVTEDKKRYYLLKRRFLFFFWIWVKEIDTRYHYNKIKFHCIESVYRYIGANDKRKKYIEEVERL